MRGEALLAALVLTTACTPVEMRGQARTCRDGTAQASVGTAAAPGTIEGIRRRTGARIVRVVRPGEMATMDYRADRVTVTVNARQAIESVRCG